MIAAAQGHIEAVKTLLSHDANVHAVDKFGKKAYEKAKTLEIARLIQESALITGLDTIPSQPDAENTLEKLNFQSESNPSSMATFQQSDTCTASNTKKDPSTPRPLLQAFIGKMKGKLHQGILKNIINEFTEIINDTNSDLRKEINQILKNECENTLSSAIDAFNSAMFGLLSKHKVRIDPKFLISEEDLSKDINLNFMLTDSPVKIPKSSSSPRSKPIKMAKNQYPNSILKKSNTGSITPSTESNDMICSVGSQLEQIGTGLMNELKMNMKSEINQTTRKIHSDICNEIHSIFNGFKTQLENSLGNLMKEKIIRLCKQMKENEAKLKKRASSPQNLEINTEFDKNPSMKNIGIFSARASQGNINYAASPQRSCKSVLRKSVSNCIKTAEKPVPKKPLVDYKYVVQSAAKIKPHVKNSESVKKITPLNSVDHFHINNKITADSSGLSNKLKEIENIGESVDYRTKMIGLEKKYRSLARFDDANNGMDFDKL